MHEISVMAQDSRAFAGHFGSVLFRHRSTQMNTDEIQKLSSLNRSVSICVNLWLKNPEETGEAITVIFSIAFWPSLKTSHEFGVACERVWRDDFNVANEPG